MAPDQPTSVPAGWYPDPHGVAELRWWDGRDWTVNVYPPVAPPVEAPVTPPTVQPIAEPAVEPTGEPAATPERGLAFPPPSINPPENDENAFGSQIDDLEDVSRVPDLVAPTTAEPVPTAAPVDSLPSRRELRERGGTVPASPPIVAAPVPDSSTPTSFDWIPGAGVAAEAATPASQPTVDSVWNAEPSAPQQDPEELYSSTPTRTSTTSGWLIALTPLFAGILSAGAVKGAENYPRYVPEGATWWMLAAGVLVLLYLVTLLLAAADRRKLEGEGHSYPAHWAWALLTAPIYLAVRTVAVKRETGRVSALLWVWIVLAALLVGGYLLTSYLAPELLAAYTLPFL